MTDERHYTKVKIWQAYERISENLSTDTVNQIQEITDEKQKQQIPNTKIPASTISKEVDCLVIQLREQ